MLIWDTSSLSRIRSISFKVTVFLLQNSSDRVCLLSCYEGILTLRGYFVKKKRKKVELWKISIWYGIECWRLSFTLASVLSPSLSLYWNHHRNRWEKRVFMAWRNTQIFKVYNWKISPLPFRPHSKASSSRVATVVIVYRIQLVYYLMSYSHARKHLIIRNNQ